jgi:hypothetical protein
MTVDEFHKRAKAAREQAEKTSNDELRSAWLSIAENYEMLAKITELSHPPKATT